jgi:hypothetical protein
VYTPLYPVGATYISSGTPIEAVPLASLFASSTGVKAVGAYLIITGLALMAAPVLIYWNFSKNNANGMLAFLAWIVCCVAVVLTFTAAVLTAMIPTPAQKFTSLSNYGTSGLI